MTRENARPKPAVAVTDGSDEIQRAAAPGTSGHVAQLPVSRNSEAIIKEVSVRRLKAIEVLANR